MSISSMSSAALYRRNVFAEVRAPAPEAREAPAVAAEAPTTPETDVTKALAKIATYIPTEILTVYVATLAAIRNTPSDTESGRWAAFIVFLVATPVAVLLVYLARLRNAGEPVRPEQRAWPWWEMVAGTIAYVAWALTLQGTPVLQRLGWPDALAGVIVLAVSAALGLIEPVLKPLRKAEGGGSPPGTAESAEDLPA